MAKKNSTDALVKIQEPIVEPENSPKPDVSIPTQKFPPLSVDNKLFIRNLQINLVTVKERAATEVRNAEQAVLDGVNSVAKALGVTTAKGFDLASLKFYD